MEQTNKDLAQSTQKTHPLSEVETKPGPKHRSNRRQSMRGIVRRSAHVECRKGAFGFGPNILVFAIDLSERGMAVLLKAPIAKGDEAELIFAGVNNGKPLKRIATVVWVALAEDNHYRAGLELQSPIPYRTLQMLIRPR